MTDPDSKSVVTGVMPSGWQDDSKWADVTVDYSEDTTGMHGGAAALKVNYSAHRGGACQFYQYVNQIQAGHSYTLSLWVKGDGKVPITLRLRQRTDPYTRFGEVSAAVGDTWTKLSATATATVTGSALFMVLPAAPTVFEVDDASLVDNGG